MRWSSSPGWGTVGGTVGGSQQTAVGERERPVDAVWHLGQNLASRVSKSKGLVGGAIK
jgi:hypothetical protein